MHYLNLYYKKLQERAEQQHRDDLLAWEWMHESENNFNALNMSGKVYAPADKQPISEAKETRNNNRIERDRMWSELYESKQHARDENEFEIHTKR